jgi:hypothetical protein
MKMPSEDDYNLVLCTRVEDRLAVVRGSLQRLCFHCGKSVWVSKATLVAASSAEEIRFACVPCGSALIPSGTQPQQPSEGQLREIADYYTERTTHGHGLAWDVQTGALRRRKEVTPL